MSICVIDVIRVTSCELRLGGLPIWRFAGESQQFLATMTVFEPVEDVEAFRPIEVENLDALGIRQQRTGYLVSPFPARLVVVGQDNNSKAGQLLGVSDIVSICPALVRRRR